MDTTELTQLSLLRALLRSGVARDIRIGAGLSLREVGGAVGAPPSTVFRWEQRQRQPRGGPAALAYWNLLRSLSSGGRP